MDTASRRLTVTLHIRYHQTNPDGSKTPISMEPDVPTKQDGGNFWFDYSQTLSDIRDAKQQADESREEFCVRLQAILQNRYDNHLMLQYDWWYRDAETGETLTKRLVGTERWRNE